LEIEQSDGTDIDSPYNRKNQFSRREFYQTALPDVSSSEKAKISSLRQSKSGNFVFYFPFPGNVQETEQQD
jgi:hypothetical protein